MEETLIDKLEKIKEDIKFHEYRIEESTKEVVILRTMFTEHIDKIKEEET